MEGTVTTLRDDVTPVAVVALLLGPDDADDDVEERIVDDSVVEVLAVVFAAVFAAVFAVYGRSGTGRLGAESRAVAVRYALMGD